MRVQQEPRRGERRFGRPPRRKGAVSQKVDVRSKAIRLLEATDLEDARSQARRVLDLAERCRCCRGLLAHLFDRLGSTLFLDDDPHQLALAFEPEERDRFSAQVLSACIVLSGRERISVARTPTLRRS
jgi:hypothetical protein